MFPKSFEEIYNSLVNSYPVRGEKKSVGHSKAGRCLYFIQCGEYVKIGISHNPYQRIRTLRDQPVTGTMSLIAVFEWMSERETSIHHKFSHLHFKKEWFYFTQEIREFIKELEKEAL